MANYTKTITGEGTLQTGTAKQQGTGATLLAAIKKKLKLWRMRLQSREELRHMNTRQLKDIGITPMDRQIEVNRPFWK